MKQQRKNLDMATNLVDYVKTYDAMVPDDFCQGILEAYGKSDLQYIDREFRPTFTQLNLTQRLQLKDPLWVDTHKKLEQYFVDAVELYMDDLQLGADFPAKYCFEEFRLKWYKPNNYDQFKEHVDIYDYNSARRFLVVFLYLNDVDQGGETSFSNLELSITPKRGRILIFPPTWMFRHAGLPPVSGDKYILGTYLHYL